MVFVFVVFCFGMKYRKENMSHYRIIFIGTPVIWIILQFDLFIINKMLLVGSSDYLSRCCCHWFVSLFGFVYFPPVFYTFSRLFFREFHKFRYIRRFVAFFSSQLESSRIRLSEIGLISAKNFRIPSISFGNHSRQQCVVNWLQVNIIQIGENLPKVVNFYFI